jgi:hypothetical protein
MGLTSGSVHWLMSRASSHAVAVGLRLSGKRRARSGHVPTPDPCLRRGPLHPGTLPRPGPYSEGPGAHPRDPTCLLGSSGLVHTRGPVSLYGGPDPTMHPRIYYLSSPCGALRPAHVVGSGAALRVTWRCRTGSVSHTVEEGTPVSRYRHTLLPMPLATSAPNLAHIFPLGARTKFGGSSQWVKQSVRASSYFEHLGQKMIKTK